MDDETKKYSFILIHIYEFLLKTIIYFTYFYIFWLDKKQEEVENYDANVSEDSTRNAIVIERTPTEVSNRSSDDETQPKPKDTKNNEKKGTSFLSSECWRVLG